MKDLRRLDMFLWPKRGKIAYPQLIHETRKISESTKMNFTNTQVVYGLWVTLNSHKIQITMKINHSKRISSFMEIKKKSFALTDSDAHFCREFEPRFLKQKDFSLSLNLAGKRIRKVNRTRRLRTGRVRSDNVLAGPR